MHRGLLRHSTTVLLGAALLITVWGAVSGSDSPRYIGWALSLVLLDFVVERVTLTQRMTAFLDDVEARDAVGALARLRDVDERTRQVEAQLADLARAVGAGTGAQLEAIGGVQDTVARHLVSFLPLLSPSNPNRGADELRHLYALRGGKVRTDGRLDVGRNDSIRLWRDCLIESTSWDALSSATELWHDHEREISNGFQKLRRGLDDNFVLRRVFVFADDQERLASDQLLRDQAALVRPGNLRWILRPRLLDVLGRQGLADHELVDDLDFAVVDGAFVLWFTLDGAGPERRLTGSRLVQDPRSLKVAKDVFTLALLNGNVFTPDRS